MISTLERHDVQRARVLLADAFRDDPLWRNMFADEAHDSPRMCSFFEVPLRYSLRYGGVFSSVTERGEDGAEVAGGGAPASDGRELCGLAAWVPGELAEMTPWRVFRSGALGIGMSIGLGAGLQMARTFAPIARDRKEHMKGRRYLYLPVVGVGSRHQGQGHGSRLLQAIIDKSERAHLPVYLETETEANVSFYEGLGFEVLEKIVLPHLELPMWEMLRRPRPFPPA